MSDWDDGRDLEDEIDWGANSIPTDEDLAPPAVTRDYERARQMAIARVALAMGDVHPAIRGCVLRERVREAGGGYGVWYPPRRRR